MCMYNIYIYTATRYLSAPALEAVFAGISEKGLILANTLLITCRDLMSSDSAKWPRAVTV